MGALKLKFFPFKLNFLIFGFGYVQKTDET